ncbi:DNA-processing protein DprA, partial [Streptomyces olivaceus]
MSGGDALPEGGALFGADALPADAEARPVGDAVRGALGDGVTGDGAPGEVADDRLLARVFLTRVVEPGDETCGRWVRERGVGEVARRLREGGPA